MDINYKVNRAQVGDGGLSYGHKNSCFQCKFFGENLKWLENVKYLQLSANLPIVHIQELYWLLRI